MLQPTTTHPATAAPAAVRPTGPANNIKPKRPQPSHGHATVSAPSAAATAAQASLVASAAVPAADKVSLATQESQVDGGKSKVRALLLDWQWE